MHFILTVINFFKMKKTILLFTVILCAINATAQNVGIGNTNPQFKLDVSGRIRIRGAADNFNTAGLWLSGIGADSTKDKLFMGMQADSVVGFYSSKIDVGWGFVFDGRNGKVGIGNVNPSNPLSFDNQGGDKISLFKDINGNYYGMGIGNSTMQLMTPHNSSSIIFGYGASNNFTENMRLTGTGSLGIGTNSTGLAGLTVNKKMGATHAIFGGNATGVAIESSFPGIGLNSYYNGSRKTMAAGYSGYIGVNPSSGGMQLLVSSQSNNTDAAGVYKTAIDIKPDGKVGIGITDPAYLLDVGERMRIRSTPGFTAGLWLNNVGNTAIPAFFGMFSDDQVGLYGSGTGWSFLMNTQTGAISFGGNAGQPGQVLTSNGTAGAPSWQSGGGSSIFIVRQNTTSAPVISGATDIPQLTADFTLSVSSRVLFLYSADVYAQDCFGCSQKRVEIRLMQNVAGGTNMIDFSNASIGNDTYLTTLVSGPAVFDFPAGTYSFKVMLSCFGNTNAGRAINGKLSWQIFPN
jgi:hypothetical protein